MVVGEEGAPAEARRREGTVEAAAEVGTKGESESTAAQFGNKARRVGEGGAPSAALSVRGNGLEAEVREAMRVGEGGAQAQVRGEGTAS